jgi:hypothetical protein
LFLVKTRRIVARCGVLVVVLLRIQFFCDVALSAGKEQPAVLQVVTPSSSRFSSFFELLQVSRDV